MRCGSQLLLNIDIISFCNNVSVGGNRNEIIGDNVIQAALRTLQ